MRNVFRKVNLKKTPSPLNPNTIPQHFTVEKTKTI